MNANASANPAVEALIWGLRIATKPVAPTTALESRLNRADNHRLTIECVNDRVCPEKSIGHTSPHPIVRVCVLSENIVNEGSDVKIKDVPYLRIEAYHVGIWNQLQKHEGQSLQQWFLHRLNIEGNVLPSPTSAYLEMFAHRPKNVIFTPTK